MPRSPAAFAAAAKRSAISTCWCRPTIRPRRWTGWRPHPLVEKVLARGETKQRVRLKSGLELDLRVVPEESYGAALQYFTGSKAHNIVMRRRAQERGLKINEYGVYPRRDVDRRPYRRRGLQVGRPAVDSSRVARRSRRDRTGEAGELPKLVELDDIRGDLHMHTTATDGAVVDSGNGRRGESAGVSSTSRSPIIPSG